MGTGFNHYLPVDLVGFHWKLEFKQSSFSHGVQVLPDKVFSGCLPFWLFYHAIFPFLFRV